MNWSSDPPRISGWWFVGAKARNGRNAININLVEIREHRHKWEWSFLNGLTWNSTDNYPKYKWAGSIESPSLENFNKAK